MNKPVKSTKSYEVRLTQDDTSFHLFTAKVYVDNHLVYTSERYIHEKEAFDDTNKWIAEHPLYQGPDRR